MNKIFTHLKTVLFVSFILLSITALLLSFLNYYIPSIISILIGVLFLSNFMLYIFSKGSFVYFLKRLVGVVVLIFTISSLTFFLLKILPGGPFDKDRSLPPAIEKNIREKYNLDANLFEQYWVYMKNLSQGDLGQSFKYTEQDVSKILADSLPISLQLGIYSLILAYLIGIPLGVFSASKHNSISDRTSMVLAISGISLPSFLVAPLLILFFCFYLNWFEVALWEGPSYYVLPVLVLGTRPAAIIARLTRTSMLDVIHSDYIRTAKAKGLHPMVILYKHVLKNAFIPVLTFSGPIVAALLTGSFVIEQIFAIPGMSKHLVLSVTNRDYPLVLGATLVYCFILIIANLIVDFLYSYFDPRIKFSKT